MNLFFLGDSTVDAKYPAKYYPQMGCAYRFGEHFTPDVTVKDHAVGGYSLRALICGDKPDFTRENFDTTVDASSWFGRMLPLVEKDDWVIIGSTSPNDAGQWHYDKYYIREEDGTVKFVEKDTPGAKLFTFMATIPEYISLVKYVCRLLKEKGAHIILITNEALTGFDEESGRYIPCERYQVYEDTKKQIAEEEGLYYLDVGKYVREVIYPRMTIEEMQKLYHMNKTSLTRFYKEEGILGKAQADHVKETPKPADNVHLNTDGALMLGNAIIDCLLASDCPLKEKIVANALVRVPKNGNFVFYRKAEEDEVITAESRVGSATLFSEITKKAGESFTIRCVTDERFTEDTAFTLRVEGANGITVTPYQMMEKDGSYVPVSPAEGILKAGAAHLSFLVKIDEEAPRGVQEISFILKSDVFSVRVVFDLTVE